MNRYLDETEDDEGFSLLPFFMAVRAAVRAHVTATQVEESDQQSEALIALARSYFDLAQTLLEDFVLLSHRDRRPERFRQDNGRGGSRPASWSATRRANR